MSKGALRPGSALGPCPERELPRLSWLDEAAHRAVGPLARQPFVSRLASRRFLARVNDAATDFSGIDAKQLTERAQVLRCELLSNGLVDDLTGRVFALIREVADRTLGLRHFDSQIIGGWVMLQGMLAEMETGEGKTLTATLPACTAAMAGIPVHVISVNDYLVTRDAKLMAPIYNVLGLSVGTITEDMRDPAARRAAYACDVTYCSNKQVAFDYLRDGLIAGRGSANAERFTDASSGGNTPATGRVLRGLCFGIVDEADSVLIDEARTPLILSKEVNKPFDDDIYRQALDLAGRLDAENGDFRIQARERNIVLSQSGKERLARLTAEMNEFWSSARRREHIINKALVAIYLQIRDQDYILRDGKVQIIDANTGRIMADRSWEGGVHQLVEAKEGCRITGSRESLARITYQRFFRRYLRLGAMTGTATEVAAELWSVYDLRVIPIASHKPSRRVGCRTRVYPTAADKWANVVARVRMLVRQQRPVLIGTRSVSASEHLSALLREAGLTHEVLNARQDRQEAEIIARAGEPGQITVATNMAGRGTDIHIGPQVATQGGLHVIATERNEAGRIDRQLFGRCARQGDPGSFEAILSLEDDIIIFCAPRPIHKCLQRIDSGELPLAQWAAAIFIRRVQRSVERRHAQARRELLRLDLRLGDALAFTGPME